VINHLIEHIALTNNFLLEERGAGMHGGFVKKEK
jgi:hypothetical protein